MAIVYTFTQADYDSFKDSATATVNGNPLIVGTSINNGDSIVFTAKAGKRFKILNSSIQLFLRSSSTTYTFTLNSDQTVGTYTVAASYPDAITYFRCTTEDLPAFANITAADISNAATRHFKIYRNDVLLTAATNIYSGDVIKVTTDSGWVFALTSNKNYLKSVNFIGGVDNWFFTPDSNAKNGSFTVPASWTTQTINFYSDANSTVVDTNVPLAWNNHPTTGTENTNVNFTWVGGDASTVNYNVVVIKGGVEVDNLTQPKATPNYNLNQPAGDYTVEVYDKGGKSDPTANKITSNITLSALPALAWNAHPDSGVLGTNSVFSWVNGVSPYSVTVLKPDGSTHATRPASTSLNYALTTAVTDPVGTYTVKVTDSAGTAKTIQQTIAMAAAPKRVKWTVTAAQITQLSNAHINMKVNGVNIVAGTVVRADDVITATGLDNYVIDQIRLSYISNAVFFTISSDKKTANYTMDNTTYVYDTLYLESHLVTPETLVGNNVYVVDNDILHEVTKNRFEFINNAEGGTFIDYGNYILSVLQLPFSIDPSLIAGNESIKLANHDTTVAADKLSVDIIKYNMGSITIPKVYNNLRDFDNTTAILYLPRAQPVAIDIEYVVGETISIEYLIDLYSGKATVNIKSTKTNDVIIQKIVDIGINIPYNGEGGRLENSSIEISGDNGVKIPYIEIMRSDAPLINGLFTIPVVDEQILNTQTGYITVENIDLISKAIKSEKDDLISILNNGVIIK